MRAGCRMRVNSRCSLYLGSSFSERSSRPLWLTKAPIILGHNGKSQATCLSPQLCELLRTEPSTQQSLNAGTRTETTSQKGLYSSSLCSQERLRWSGCATGEAGVKAESRRPKRRQGHLRHTASTAERSRIQTTCGPAK